MITKCLYDFSSNGNEDISHQEVILLVKKLIENCLNCGFYFPDLQNQQFLNIVLLRQKKKKLV